MADFNKWNHDALAEFAKEAAERLAVQDQRIAQLEADLRMMQEAWREALRKPSST